MTDASETPAKRWRPTTEAELRDMAAVAGVTTAYNEPMTKDPKIRSGAMPDSAISAGSADTPRLVYGDNGIERA